MPKWRRTFDVFSRVGAAMDEDLAGGETPTIGARPKKRGRKSKLDKYAEAGFAEIYARDEQAPAAAPPPVLVGTRASGEAALSIPVPPKTKIDVPDALKKSLQGPLKLADLGHMARVVIEVAKQEGQSAFSSEAAHRFWDPACSSWATTSQQVRTDLAGEDGKSSIRLERRMASAADLTERFQHSELQDHAGSNCLFE